MNKQRKVVITTTYNEMGIVIDTKAEELAQPEEAIPVSWIEARIKRFMTMDNAFGGLTANIMLVMLNEWKREQEGETE